MSDRADVTLAGALSGTGGGTAASDAVYLYDGTFDGLLCCIYEAVYGRETPADVLTEQTLLPAKPIETDLGRAGRVARGIKDKISPAAFDFMQAAFRASEPKKDWHIVRFALLGFKQGGKVMNMLTDEHVAAVAAMKKTVWNEAHRMKEFVRFSDYGDALVSVIEPKHDVLELITGHFSDRLNAERFMIYDEGRGKAFVYDNGQGGILYLDKLELPPASEEEVRFRALWKLFYDTVEIKSRHNERCQNTHLPKYYRKHMTEFKP